MSNTTLIEDRHQKSWGCWFGRGDGLPDTSVKQFLASLRFDQTGNLDQLGIETGSFE